MGEKYNVEPVTNLRIINPLREEDLRPNAWERAKIRELYEWERTSRDSNPDLRIK